MANEVIKLGHNGHLLFDLDTCFITQTEKCQVANDVFHVACNRFCIINKLQLQYVGIAFIILYSTSIH
jgi:hypothetical protein